MLMQWKSELKGLKEFVFVAAGLPAIYAFPLLVDDGGWTLWQVYQSAVNIDLSCG